MCRVCGRVCVSQGCNTCTCTKQDDGSLGLQCTREVCDECSGYTAEKCKSVPVGTVKCCAKFETATDPCAGISREKCQFLTGELAQKVIL